MSRALIFFLLLSLAAVGAVWLVDRPEDVALIWNGQRIETSLAALAAAILILAAALALLWSLLRYLFRLPRRFGASGMARRRERGQAALSKGLIAVGAGDLPAAQRYAREASRMLGGAPLSLLLEAQAAQLAGDRAAARRAFEAMSRAGEARLLGWRGLFVEAKRSGDEEAARAAAEAAAKIAPAAAWANEALLADRFSRGDWAGARLALEQAERLRVLDKPTSKRQRAVLLTAEAQELQSGDPARALALAREACDLVPDLVPAAVLAARLMAERGDLRRAARLIETAWRSAPHPDLADAYVHLRAGDSALDRLGRARALAKLAPDDAESAVAVARAALDARELAAARAALAPLAAGRPTMRVCLLMADLAELGEGDQGETRAWLGRAARAPRDKAWIGDGFVSERWLPVSPASGRLDAFVWADPPELLAGAPPPASAADASAILAAAPAAPPAAVPATEEIGPPAAGRAPAPTPVIFPVAHAPDDPGPKQPAGGDWRGAGG